MDELHALRRAGRARRVDQRQHVVAGRSARPTASTSKLGAGALDLGRARSCPPAASPSTTTTCSRSGRSSRASSTCGEERLLGHEDPRAGVGDDVLDLLGRVGVVDRERRRPDASSPRGRRGGTRAGWRTSARPCRPCCSPSPARPAGERVDALAQLAPRDRERVALRADGDLVGRCVDGVPERLGDRRRVDACAGAVLLSMVLPPRRLCATLPHPEALAAAAARCRSTARSRTARSRA